MSEQDEPHYAGVPASLLGIKSELTDAQHGELLAQQRLRALNDDQYLELLAMKGLEEEAAVADAEESFREYAAMMWPIMEAGQPMTRGWATDAICDHLQAVTENEIQNLAIFVPPGMAKTKLTCVYWPTWEWGPRNMPHLRYITASYSEDLTLESNRWSRTLIDTDTYVKWWRKDEQGVEKWKIDPKQDSKTEFATNKVGFRFATSTGGTITGKRGHRLIFDDLHSASQAESDQIRQGQVTWFRESAQNRVVDKHAKKVLIMQLLHAADVGSVARELGWTILCLPMRFEHDHPLVWLGGPRYETLSRGRKRLVQWGKGDPRMEEYKETGEDGQLLFPERFDEDFVADMEEAMGDYAVAGQYQQRPTPRGGGMCKADLIEIVPFVPDGVTLITSRGWDFASSKKKGSAFTAHARLGLDRDSGTIYILDCRMDRFSPDELEAEIVRAATIDGLTGRQAMPKDPAQAGDFQAHVISNLLHGHTFEFGSETGSKEDRFKPFASQVNVGKVKMVAGDWNERPAGEKHRQVPSVKTMLGTFPMGKFKDLCDAISRAYMDLVMQQGNDMGVPEPPRVLKEHSQVDDGYAFRRR